MWVLVALHPNPCWKTCYGVTPPASATPRRSEARPGTHMRRSRLAGCPHTESAEPSQHPGCVQWHLDPALAALDLLECADLLLAGPAVAAINHVMEEQSHLVPTGSQECQVDPPSVLSELEVRCHTPHKYRRRL